MVVPLPPSFDPSRVYYGTDTAPRASSSAPPWRWSAERRLTTKITAGARKNLDLLGCSAC